MISSRARSYVGTQSRVSIPFLQRCSPESLGRVLSHRDGGSLTKLTLQSYIFWNHDQKIDNFVANAGWDIKTDDFNIFGVFSHLRGECLRVSDSVVSKT